MAQSCRTVRQVKQGERLRRSQHTAHTLMAPGKFHHVIAIRTFFKQRTFENFRLRVLVSTGVMF